MTPDEATILGLARLCAELRGMLVDKQVEHANAEAENTKLREEVSALRSLKAV